MSGRLRFCSSAMNLLWLRQRLPEKLNSALSYCLLTLGSIVAGSRLILKRKVPPAAIS